MLLCELRLKKISWDYWTRTKCVSDDRYDMQIPGNTGSIARTCAASAVGLHLVGVRLVRIVLKIEILTSKFRDYFFSLSCY